MPTYPEKDGHWVSLSDVAWVSIELKPTLATLLHRTVTSTHHPIFARSKPALQAAIVDHVFWITSQSQEESRR